MIKGAGLVAKVGAGEVSNQDDGAASNQDDGAALNSGAAVWRTRAPGDPQIIIVTVLIAT